MDSFANLSIETLIAILFGITALTTVVMSLWAYVYQHGRNSVNESKIQDSDKKREGHFFIRIKPN